MFVLDTNILSAMMSTQAVPQVAAWIAGQPADLLFTTSVSQAEILSGLAIMAEGRRRLDLEAAARAMFLEDSKDACCRSTWMRPSPMPISSPPARGQGDRQQQSI